MPNLSFQYTNGYDLQKVQPVLLDRIKWKGSASKSGRYFDDGSFHALLTEQNLRDTNQPGEVLDGEVGALKTAFTKAAVLRALSAVFPGPSLIDKPEMLFDLNTPRAATAAVSGDLVGWKLEIAETSDILVQLKDVVLSFTGTGDVTLYLYRIGDPVPVWQQTVALTGGRYTVVELKDCYIPYRSFKQTRFFFGYKPSELPVGVLPYTEDYCEVNCFAALNACPVQMVVLPGYEGDYLYPSKSYGINLEVVSMYDHTENIIRGAAAFDDLIGLTGVAIMLEQAIYAQRINGTERGLKDTDKMMLQMDLTGAVPISDVPQTDGLRYRIQGLIKAVRSSFIKQNGAVV